MTSTAAPDYRQDMTAGSWLDSRAVPPRPSTGLLLAAIWLIYLGDPLRALLDHPPGWPRLAGLFALAAFCVVYLWAMSRGRRSRYTGTPTRLRLRWATVIVMALLVTAMIPGARFHALAAAVFVAATAAMSLPKYQAVGAVIVIFTLAEGLPHVVDGWEDDGYGLAVALAALAVWGLRTVFERNRQLLDAQRRLAAAAVQDERSRIAADLHDILGHSLTVITIKAELAGRLLEIDVDRARTELNELESLSRNALSDVRTTALGLRGVSLPGEIAAARSALRAAGISAELPSVADEVPTQWRELFAWTIREAVTNLIRHSGASRCAVRLSPHGVDVVDDGHGYVGTQQVGQGLAGLIGRSEAAGAKIEIGDRADHHGFRVHVEVPS